MATNQSRDISDAIADVFDRCSECGRILNPRVPTHNCSANAYVERNLSDSRREKRDARADADNGDPDEYVVSVEGGHGRTAYHEAGPGPEGIEPACSANTYHDPDDFRALPRGEAKRQGNFPCNACFPRVARRANRIYAEIYGGNPDE